MAEKIVWLYPHKCKVCGKPFECRSEYAYKINGGKGFMWFCSYKHMREYEKAHEKRNAPTQRQQEALDLLAEGYPISKICEMIKASHHWVEHVRDRWVI